jgi:cation diffusion facilitator CzcD-associated flavoprotein CzcO
MTAVRSSSPTVLVLGAGLSGVLAGIKLKEAGIDTFEILEMGDSVGGTWRDNTYPGLSCDVPAHAYDYSFEPNWQWKSMYAAGPELHAYFKFCADKYGVTSHVRFDTRVSAVERKNGLWTVTSTDGVQRQAQIVINALGSLVHPKDPEIAGLETFKGARFHSARWNHSVPLDGRRIGVIGTGSTAVQILCALAGRAGKLEQYQRTAQWICPNFDTRRPQWLRALHRTLPGLSTLTGQFQNWMLESTVFSALVGENRFALRTVEAICRRHLARVKDPSLREKLTPRFQVGCRRLILSDTYYDAIQKPGVALVTEGIERIEPEGIRTRDGKLHELDVIVTATGFHALDYTRALAVTNEQGQRLDEVWAQGAEALRSVAVAGFPNYFMLLGPHSPIGNASLTAVSETQMRAIMKLIVGIQRGDYRSIVPRPEAQTAYNNRLRGRFNKTQWVTGCTSWYLDPKGLPRIYPSTPKVFRRELDQLDVSEFELGRSTPTH